MRAFDRRKVWQKMGLKKYLLGGLVVIGAVAFAAKAHGADLEIVPYKPSQAKTQQTTVKKADAMAYARELDAVRFGLTGALMKQERWPSFTQRVNALTNRADKLFGSQALGSPFASCGQAAAQIQIAWQTTISLTSGRHQADFSAVSSLFNASVNYGDAYRTCRAEVDALPN